jgi:hypothetical protein
MKIKLTRSDAYWLEDLLLDVSYGLPVSSYEGDERITRIVNTIQDRIYKEDIADDV